MTGGLAYWPEGNAVAIFHGADPDRTEVPVILVGLLDDGIPLFAGDIEAVTIEAVANEG